MKCELWLWQHLVVWLYMNSFTWALQIPTNVTLAFDHQFKTSGLPSHNLPDTILNQEIFINPHILYILAGEN